MDGIFGGRGLWEPHRRIMRVRRPPALGLGGPGSVRFRKDCQPDCLMQPVHSARPFKERDLARARRRRLGRGWSMLQSGTGVSSRRCIRKKSNRSALSRLMLKHPTCSACRAKYRELVSELESDRTVGSHIEETFIGKYEVEKVRGKKSDQLMKYWLWITVSR